ncbi:MAG: hypothetical protein COV52_02580 [Gammaproteobacteria bacterium CG11_big_fil_rev_8_21_14_0_20_46_22]|nr:MAG: hypothetical protein COW05_08620 [Gammaproteobacteria bacterium CG12_big_fil_rev_8_21_14_0_65_46_12]PIR11666.1 MAG: hypothetical protein COV52_02580 [Gammaproteobacteria bacterium CG11_big_fil_rev_8_21_14_0_20_46_22]
MAKTSKPIWIKVRKYMLTGLVVWLPLAVTLYIIIFIVSLMDKSVKLLPHAFQPQQIFGFHIPGLGLILTLLVLFFTGMFVTNFFGQKLFSIWEKMVGRIPLVRSIYMGVKQIVEALVEPSGKAFRKVYLIEYPRKGTWSIAFQTGVAASEITKAVHQNTLTLFVPTTPNPTSGFLLMVPADEAKELDMSVDQALKMVISLGVVQPKDVPLVKPDQV